MRNRFLKNSLLLFLLVFAGGILPAQNKQAELEEKRRLIEEEIRQINTLIFNTQKKERSALEEVEDIAQRIRVRENLIKVTNEQANLLTREINSNLSKIDQLRKELELLKEDYAKMVVKSYKSRSEQNRIMFLLSSQNFLQAYKRVQYMQQYTKYRKEQGIQIEQKTVELQELNKTLIVQQRDKQKLIDENRAARTQLQNEKKQQEQLMATLKQDEKKYTSQVREKQREAAEIDKEIERLIREAIAEANREANRNNTATTSGSATTFAMTPEAKALAASFTSNKGKLPSPVERGIVVTRFGTTQHPTLPNVKTQSSGVEFATEENAKARAVFDGEVIAVMVIKGATRAVQIRHGDYITVYQNLTDVYVKKGDKVSTKQEIGKVFTNPSTGKTILKFLIFQNTNKLNPSDWIYRI